MSLKGVRSSSVLTGTTLGASPMALSDATIATYQMIHIAQSPPMSPQLQVPRWNCWRQERWNWDLCYRCRWKSLKCDFPATLATSAALVRRFAKKAKERAPCGQFGWASKIVNELA